MCRVRRDTQRQRDCGRGFSSLLLRGQSQVVDLEQAIGQYSLYRILLNQIDPERELYLAISEATYGDIFDEPIGKLAIAKIPLKLVIVNLSTKEITQWIPSNPIKQ